MSRVICLVCAVGAFILAFGCSNSHTSTDDGGLLDVLRLDSAGDHDAPTAVDAPRPSEVGAVDAPVDVPGPVDDAPFDAARLDGGLRRAGRVACGTFECDATMQGCLASCLYATGEMMPACVDLNADGTWPDGECPTGMEMFPRYWLVCDASDDCAAGEECQLVRGSLGQYAQCNACPAPCNHEFFEILCASDADCPADAPRCLATTELPGYATCRP